MNDSQQADKQNQDEERTALLYRVAAWMELPMAILGFVWLVLLILDFVQGLTPLLARLTTLIWVIFILEFLLEFAIAPRKLAYLKRNWLTAIALVAPALRVLSIFRALRAIQGLRLVRVVASLNRGMRALATSLGRHGFRYVAALTLLVTLAGAAGIYAFERNAPNSSGLNNYPEALWWTAMIMTTLGSGYWPQTAEGRVLTVILSLYAFSVFGYVTAALASFLVGREAQQDQGELPSAKSIAALHDEITSLRDEVRALSERLPKDEP